MTFRNASELARLASEIQTLLRAQKTYERMAQPGAVVFRGRVRVFLENGETDDLHADEARVYLAWLVEQAAKPTGPAAPGGASGS